MFHNNIGHQIKNVAKIFFWVSIVISVIGGLAVSLTTNDMLSGFLITMIGFLGAWFSSLLLYGFGQLIENSDILVSSVTQIKRSSTSRSTSDYTVDNATGHQWRCNRCGNITTDDICPTCNKDKIDTLDKWKKDGLITNEEYHQKRESLKNEQA